MTEPPDSVADAPETPTSDIDCLCPLGGVMDLLSSRYAMQVICVVGELGPARYGDIEAAFETVSSSTLSTRLDELVEVGILSRQQYAEVPSRVEYQLSETGEELRDRIVPLLEWAEALDEDTIPEAGE